MEPRWQSVPSALRLEAHAEWGLYKILECMGLHLILSPGEGQSRTKLKKDIEEEHLAFNIDFEEGVQETFISCRPDGPAFDKENKSRVFLEYTIQASGPPSDHKAR